MSLPTKKKMQQSYLLMMRYEGSSESLGRGAAIGLFAAFAIPIALRMGLGAEIFLSFFAGALFFGIFSGFFGYVGMVSLVRNYRQRKTLHRGKPLWRAGRKVCE
jgi:uncharacterized protein (DUF2062 family)